MKAFITFLLLGVLASSSGCMSTSLIRKARGKQAPSDATWMTSDAPTDGQPHPEYYAFLLATVPLDAATLPFQAIGYGVMAGLMAGGGH